MRSRSTPSRSIASSPTSRPRSRSTSTIRSRGRRSRCGWISSGAIARRCDRARSSRRFPCCVRWSKPGGSCKTWRLESEPPMTRARTSSASSRAEHGSTRCWATCERAYRRSRGGPRRSASRRAPSTLYSISSTCRPGLRRPLRPRRACPRARTRPRRSGSTTRSRVSSRRSCGIAKCGVSRPRGGVCLSWSSTATGARASRSRSCVPAATT